MAHTARDHRWYSSIESPSNVEVTTSNFRASSHSARFVAYTSVPLTQKHLSSLVQLEPERQSGDYLIHLLCVRPLDLHVIRPERQSLYISLFREA